MSDPMRPLTERTPDELGRFADTHLLYALEAADLLHGDRDLAEDYVRDRLVALSDTYAPGEVRAESSRRRMQRLRAMLADAEIVGERDA